MKRILIVEPYYGGSHKQFLIGLHKNLNADFTFLTLPARKWKMRMQLSAPWFANCIKNLENRYFDRVLCSTFVDVAVLKALLTSVQDWNKDCEFCTYFHENQFVYPLQQDADQSSHQFTAINFTTALASERIAFNSEYNLRTFLENSLRYVKKAADININSSFEEIKRKSTVLYPGIDYQEFTSQKRTNKQIPVIIWNHRWEHDKNPEGFFTAISELEKKGYDYKISILGQSFRNVPEIFEIAKEKFSHRIQYFGFAKSREDYIYQLQQGNIVVSTARHEFFGISVLEAVHAGCYPIVPNRLSYPELYPAKYLYKDGQLASKLAEVLAAIQNGIMESDKLETERFSWERLLPMYQSWLLDDKDH